MRIIIIAKDDLVYYPPTISLINVLISQGYKVVCVGRYSDEQRRTALEKEGVEFVPIYREIKDSAKLRLLNWMVILWRMKQYQWKMKKYLQSSKVGKEDLIWFIYSNTIGYLQNYLEKHNYVVQFYEFEDYSLKGKEKLLHPKYDVHRFLINAKALIHCEYNRAMITNGLYGIKKEPIILPNKPYEYKVQQSIAVPDEVSRSIERIKDKVKNKKVILYQGIFNPYERRLDEFCEAMALLPEDFVFIAMGGGGGYFDEIKKKYESDRILFIPFIKPPYHLLITQLANYGILTYHPVSQNYVDVINPLYCAPNKIFEFGQYGIPMIANDVPGLKLIFDTYKCGKTVSDPQTPQKIAETILDMQAQYELMSRGSKAYYDSVNVVEIVKNVINL